jgi:hypothetical protein
MAAADGAANKLIFRGAAEDGLGDEELGADVKKPSSAGPPLYAQVPGCCRTGRGGRESAGKFELAACRSQNTCSCCPIALASRVLLV